MSSPRISSFTIIVAFVAVSLVGLAVIPELTVKLSPSRTLPSLTVRFSMSGSSARIVEMEVTSKLEAMLGRIDGVRKISSRSNNNGGSITLQIDKHASMDIIRFEASTIVRQTWPSLPSNTSYPSIYVNVPNENNSRSFMNYNINATVPPILIQQYAEENIRPALAQLPGVYRVDVTGATPIEWHLEYDVTQLDVLGITVNNIREAISAYSMNQTLGLVLTDDDEDNKRQMRLSITTESADKSKSFNATEIFLTDREGNMARLDQLVKVTHREAQPNSYFRINGLNSIYITITATENANQLRLSKAIKEEMKKIEQLIPNGYELHIMYDATEYIEKELNKIYIRTILTIIILLVFIFITTFNPRYLLLIVISLFFNIAIAFIFYYLAGLEIQMYSLAGITISLSLVIDNTIIMADHYLRNRNRKIFLPILAATLTSVGALGMIFFLNESIRLNLQDFAAVVIINLLVSLAVSLFLVPSAIEKLNVRKKQIRLKLGRVRYSPKRITAGFNKVYFFIIRFLFRFRKLTVTFLILAFGIPVFMIPDKVTGESEWAKRYNDIMSKPVVKEKVRPVVEKALGGTIRLFVQKVYTGSYRSGGSGELSFSISASMPNGTTVQQMNRIVQEMESYLSEHKEIRQFQTNINSARNANIRVYFTKESENTGFPYQLRNDVISKALQLGGGSWGVSALPGQYGFSNDTGGDSAGNNVVIITGYNYDDLYTYTDTLRHRLLADRRIKDVLINPEYSYRKDNYDEFTFSLDLKRMAAENILPRQLNESLRPVFWRDVTIGNVIGDGTFENIKLSSRQSRQYDLWTLANLSRYMNGKYYKSGELAEIVREQTPPSIIKEEQQYQLVIQYDYIGSSQQGTRKLDAALKQFNEELPLGYFAQTQRNYYNWTREDNKQYLYLGLIIFIIFFMTAILFNSLKQPLAIIFVIPVSYIGVFLTFYLFKWNFDDGGFASFVLLCAITINASIYLISEYNKITKRKPLMSPVKAYIKSWNIKIVPIFLTIISTVLGFIPFIVGFGREPFWFPLAVGTIGGLLMSFVGIFFFLPLFLIKRRIVIPKKVKRASPPAPSHRGGAKTTQAIP